MRKILVTGGCGFVGVNLIDYLRRTTDWDIVVLDNQSLGKKDYLAPYRVTFIDGDIRDAESVSKAVSGVTSIVHLAADTRVIDSIENPAHNFDVNVRGTFCLLEAARRAGIKRLVFASTGGAIIGAAQPPVHEGMVPKPTAPYGASKLFGEGYLSAYSASYGMNATALRFSNVYGPRSYHKGSAVAQFFKNVLAGKEITVFGDGTQTRDYVHVDDICSAIALALTVEKSGSVYQLGSGIATSVNELLDLIRVAIHPNPMPEIKYMPFRAGELVHTHSSIEKAVTELGYRPTRLLAEGIAETWKWFLSHNKEI
ncbi:NAD-dependent epimerase/dehydratase family protein [Bradyrhizobium sp. CCBAU 53415]|uniref:NAD-dependent epimerase/dehydratase family protein n=1 Tax=Bradyrhizobium sp. CCBAU 53415 TaxID=1325119 RepID=UPI002304FB5F|nr:NAD-dependent epimerase/dehydratase family protein [Bradyrhizobium sp. CCBAU 53415]MDA9464508.1 epimerase [Bradyrhizobium sp. CCBAU 53415]